jgi:hypothetical protein
MSVQEAARFSALVQIVLGPLVLDNPGSEATDARGEPPNHNIAPRLQNEHSYALLHLWAFMASCRMNFNFTF